MNDKTKYPFGLPQRDFAREGQRILREVQGPLLPEHAHDVIAINVSTGEYVLGRKPREVRIEFRKKWPDQLAFITRVDGGPVVRFYGK
jgi:hypothetical protein